MRNKWFIYLLPISIHRLCAEKFKACSIMWEKSLHMLLQMSNGSNFLSVKPFLVILVILPLVNKLTLLLSVPCMAFANLVNSIWGKFFSKLAFHKQMYLRLYICIKMYIIKELLYSLVFGYWWKPDCLYIIFVSAKLMIYVAIENKLISIHMHTYTNIGCNLCITQCYWETDGCNWCIA